MRLLLILSVILFLNSCNTSDEKDDITKRRGIERAELSHDSKVFLGNRLFSEKTCITCHAVNSKKKKGPSIVEIVGVYKEKDADIHAFLRGKSKPIVSTNDSLIAIMQANIDGFLKKITDEELDAIETYMHHVTDLKSKK